jgi:hypothetical protein
VGHFHVQVRNPSHNPERKLSRNASERPKSASKFALELGPNVDEDLCKRCGNQLLSVCGFIRLDGDAYSTYFALRQTAHDEIVAAPRISIGNWRNDDAQIERHWIEPTVKPSEPAFNMHIEEHLW